MSLGSISLNVFVPVTGEVNDNIGTPSMTQRGSEKRLVDSIDKLLNPRMDTEIPPPPGEPVMLTTFIPATRPCNRLASEGEGMSFKSSDVTVDIAPTTFRLLCSP